jgi:hypothetical protein
VLVRIATGGVRSSSASGATAVLDASCKAVSRLGHVVSALGWGTHSLAPLSFKAARYCGIFTLHPILSGEGHERYGAILREATRRQHARRGLKTGAGQTRTNRFEVFSLLRYFHRSGRRAATILKFPLSGLEDASMPLSE